MPGRAAATRRNSYENNRDSCYCSHHIKLPLAFLLPTHLLHVVSGFSTRFDKHYVQLFRFSLALLRRHLPLVGQISFISHQHDDHVAPTLRSHVVDPLWRLMKGIGIWKEEKMFFDDIFCGGKRRNKSEEKQGAVWQGKEGVDIWWMVFWSQYMPEHEIRFCILKDATLAVSVEF